MSEKLEIIPFGGIGEFGMNCLGIRYRDEIVVVDAGMGFPDETPFGVDISVPDFGSIDDYNDEIIALFLTHGHEDHIGATPYFLKHINVPVYLSRLTAAFVERKLAEHDLLDETLLHRVSAGDRVEVGYFGVEFVHASHSLVDCFSLAIKTPVGTIFHTGDYKIDDEPVIGAPYDLKALKRIGDEGVLALLGDSTNATVPGRTPSETAVIPDLEKVFEYSRGRMFVTTFSSSLHRIQIVLDLAEIYGRRVCVLGRSMMQNVEIAEELGFLQFPPGLLIDRGLSKSLSDDEVVYLITGSQAEPRAVMWNLATQSYKGLRIEPGDTVVLSARSIPGNERRISKMIGEICRRGGEVIEEKRRLIHVSGHGSQEDIRIMTQLVKPRFLIPVHGEYRMLDKHKKFAVDEMGFNPESVKLIENGDVLEINPDAALVVEQSGLKRSFIDNNRGAEISDETVRQRRKLAFSGFATVNLNMQSGTQLLSSPNVLIRGVAPEGDPKPLENEVTSFVENIFGELSNEFRGADLAEEMRIRVRKYIATVTGVRPEVVVSLSEINES